MENEIWKALVGYEGIYEVSTKGRIRSLDRQVKRRQHIMTLKGKVLKPGINPVSGYKVVNLRKDGKSKSWNLHQLLALTFLDHKLDSGLVIDHKDEISANNDINNLQLITQHLNTVKGNNKRTDRPPGINRDNTRNKWTAKISINGKRKFIGRFDTQEEAGMAYQQALDNLD